MYDKKKIIFILPSLCAGGAERVMSFVSQQLNSSNFDVKLIVLGFKKDAVYDVNALEVKYLNKKRLLTSVLALLKVFIKEKPSIIVSSIGHVNIIMGFFSIFFRKIKFVAREASVFSNRNEFSKLNPKINLTLMKFFYPRLSAIICQSEDMRNDFINKININPSKLVLINNPITMVPKIERTINFENKLRFITVGRLSNEKGHSRIIEGLSKINKYDYHYTIIGSGPQEGLIRGELDKLQLNKKVTFIPFTSRVLEEVIKNDYFLQGSYVEGFPNALLESCTVGTPVIAFNCPGGTKEIVENGFNGFLVEDEVEFISILNNIDKLKSIKKDDVKSSVYDKFNSERIINKYETLFNHL